MGSREQEQFEEWQFEEWRDKNMSRRSRHFLVVEIECLDTQGAHQAEDRLLRWLEIYGHTASGHGFEFFSVGRVAAKPVRHRMKRKPVAISDLV